MSDDIANQLESIQSRIRTLESTYRAGDRQVQLQRLGQGPTPRQLGYSEPIDTRMGVSSGFGDLGGVQPWHGQSNLLLDPTFERGGVGTIYLFNTSAGSNGWWSAFFVLNTGAPPSTFAGNALFGELIGRNAPNDNPFSSAIHFLYADLPGGVRDTDFYLYPATPFSPGAIPRLPYLVAAARWVLDWSSVGGSPTTGVTITLTMQLVELAGPTIVAESQPRTSPSEEGQLQLWCATDMAEEGDWQWRLKVHVTSTAATTDWSMAIGIAEPQLHYAYTTDPIPFQPAIAAWSQDVPAAYTPPAFATPVAVGGSNADGSASTLVRSDHVHAGATTGHTHVVDVGTITGPLTLTGVINADIPFSPINNWNPTGLSTCSVIRLTVSGSHNTVTGMVAQPAGTVILIFNIGTTYTANFQAEDAGSTAANRFAANIGLGAGYSTAFWYDGTSQRWRPLYRYP